MKVGLLTYGLDRPLTGIGRYTIELAAALSHLEEDLEITLLQAGSSVSLRGEHFRRVPLPGCRLLPGLMTLGNFIIPWYAHRLDLDIIHDPIGVAPFLFGAGRAKTIITVHDVLPWSYPGTSALLDIIIYRLWLPRTIRDVRAVITASDQSRADILRFLPVSPDRLHVLSYGIAACFHPLPSSDVGNYLAQRFGIISPYILCVGGMALRKNIARLLEAFFTLEGEFPLLQLVLVGPPYGKKKQVGSMFMGGKMSDRILRTGPVSDSDLALLYNGCDLFVFPSLYEGFGLPPLEAMACGAPVVCSNASSLPEVVGEAALLVNPLETQDLADAIRKVLANVGLRAEMRAKGLLQAQKFSWKRNAEQTMEIYRKVVYD